MDIRKGAMRTYLERGSVHACTQMYTRGYIMVYTRVHFSLLGSRYMLGAYRPRIEEFLSSEWSPWKVCPQPPVHGKVVTEGILSPLRGIIPSPRMEVTGCTILSLCDQRGGSCGSCCRSRGVGSVGVIGGIGLIDSVRRGRGRRASDG